MQHNTNEQQTEPDETLVLPSAGYDYQFATRHKFVRVGPGPSAGGASSERQDHPGR